MLTRLLGGFGSAAMAFARYRISALGVRKFMVEVAGIYAIDEIVDLAKPYSKWVEENEDEIVIFLSLGYMAKNSLASLINRSGISTTTKILFSKIPFSNSVRSFGAWASNYTVKASNHGVVIMEGGKEILSIAKKGSKLALNHSGGPAVSAILAAGLGGALPTNRAEWEATGGQLAAQLSDMEYSLSEFELRSRLQEFSPVTLMRSGHRIVESFIRENPNFSEERAVSMLTEIMATADTIAGQHSIDGFIDADDDFVVRIDGTYFKLEEKSNTKVLVPTIPADGSKRPVPEDQEGVLFVLTQALNQVNRDGGLSLMRVAETDRFISTPFSVGRYTLALVLDLENPVPTFVFSEDSLFDSSQENLEDDLDEQSGEMISRWISAIPEFFGVGDEKLSELERESELSLKLQTVLPLLGATYRSGMVLLDAEDLKTSMGKYRPVLA